MNGTNHISFCEQKLNNHINLLQFIWVVEEFRPHFPFMELTYHQQLRPTQAAQIISLDKLIWSILTNETALLDTKLRS